MISFLFLLGMPIKGFGAEGLQRYELNDKYISVIGEYIPSKRPGKPNKLVFKDK